MPTTSPQASPPLDEFVRDLIQFTHACGSPHYRELAKLAPGVLAGHKKRIPVLRPLSLTAISNVLSRQRQGPQDWGWVATFVLTCLHYVEKTGIEPDFPGPATLQDWHARYQLMRDELAGPQARPAAVREAESARPADARRTDPAPPAEARVAVSVASARGGDRRGEKARAEGGRRAGAGAGTDGAPSPSGEPADPEPDSAAPPDQDDEGHWLPGLPSRAHRRYHDLFGRHGIDLLDTAERGDSDAACRLGILLLCHDRPAEAHAWLTSAAAAGDEAAKVLINAEPAQRRPMAAELAYEFTLPGYRQDRTRDDPGTPTGAETYYRAAACAGHPGATVRMGLIYEARGEAAAAQYTFAEATRRHHDAHSHFTRLNARYAQRRPPEQTS